MDTHTHFATKHEIQCSFKLISNLDYCEKQKDDDDDGDGHTSGGKS